MATNDDNVVDKVIFKTFDDGYIVRSMSPAEARKSIEWFAHIPGGMTYHSLQLALSSQPGRKGFYVGEFEGRMVASLAMIPWSGDMYYGVLYYVDEDYRGRGFWKRIHQVGLDRIGENILSIDALEGAIGIYKKHGHTGTNVKTGRFQTTAKISYGIGIATSFCVMKASEVPFQKLIEYDNKCFISTDFIPRRKFLQKWIEIEEGAAYVAKNSEGSIVGYGCRQPCVHARNHMVGPLYADSPDVAAAILQQLCSDVAGDSVATNIWYTNNDAVKLLKEFEFSSVWDALRMYINGDPQKYKKEVYACTSMGCCGF